MRAFVSIITSDEMYDAVQRCRARLRCARHVRRGRRLQAGEIFGAEVEEERRRRSSLDLVPTRDILASIAKEDRIRSCVVGFAAETEQRRSERAEKTARKKLRHDRGK